MNEKVKKHMRISSYVIGAVSIVAISWESGIVAALGVFGLLWANNITKAIS